MPWPQENEPVDIFLTGEGAESSISALYVDTVTSRDGSELLGHLVVTEGERMIPGEVKEYTTDLEIGTERTADKFVTVPMTMFIPHAAIRFISWENQLGPIPEQD